MTTPDLEVLADASAVADRAVALMREIVADAIKQRGTARIALSGGSTPGETYRRYAAGGAPDETRWYFVDERCVPPDSDRSNYAAARSDLFSRANIPDAHVFRMEGERDAEEGARDYARLLADVGATMDLVIAGMGNDGHTASLFPGTGAVHREGLVTVVDPGGGLERRITLTRPVLLGARRVLVLVTGASKQKPLALALSEGPEDEIPSRLYRAAPAGVVTWLCDRAAKP
jgi:6-phosphogluconolactonase